MSPPRIPVRDRILERVKKDGECWIYTGSATRDGYGVLGVGRGKQVRAHRAAYETFVAPIPAGMMVCHACDVPRCINPRHLFVGTPKQNSEDMVRKGRQPYQSGECGPRAKLSNVDVFEILARRESGELLKGIALRFGVSISRVSAIYRGSRT